MTKKQKSLLISLLLSLTVLIVVFQNCSPSNNGELTNSDLNSLINGGDGSGNGGGTSNSPSPTIAFSTSSTCSPSQTSFPASSTSKIYVCVQNIGTGVTYELYDNYSLIDTNNIPSARWTSSNGWYSISYLTTNLYNSGFYSTITVVLGYQGSAITSATFTLQ